MKFQVCGYMFLTTKTIEGCKVICLQDNWSRAYPTEFDCQVSAIIHAMAMRVAEEDADEGEDYDQMVRDDYEYNIRH